MSLTPGETMMTAIALAIAKAVGAAQERSIRGIGSRHHRRGGASCGDWGGVALRDVAVTALM
jgi:hypothetical protein